MKGLKFYDEQHTLLTIEHGLPEQLNKYAIKDADAYHINVAKAGYMLFQHLSGGIWDIWLSHYVFNRKTTIYCEGAIEGIEFHNIIEGYALYQNGYDEWQHFGVGDHNILYNPKIKSSARFNQNIVVTFDVHLSTQTFKGLTERQPAFKKWVTYFSKGINTRLYKTPANKNIFVQAILTEVIEKCQLALFDGNSNKELLGKFLDSVLHNETINCPYNYTFEDVKHIIETKDLLKASVNEKIKVTELGASSLMGSKKFIEGFKMLFGVAPITFLIRERIRVCKNILLQENNLTNDDYATIMNFNSGSHFARTFKMFEGCTPKEYKKRHLEEIKSWSSNK